jgi:hypothetical protein
MLENYKMMKKFVLLIISCLLTIILASCATINYSRTNQDGSVVTASGFELFTDGAFSGLTYQGDGKGAMAFGIEDANRVVSPEMGKLIADIIQGAVQGAK